jgi:hypothetical protein
MLEQRECGELCCDAMQNPQVRTIITMINIDRSMVVVGASSSRPPAWNVSFDSYTHRGLVVVVGGGGGWWWWWWWW